MPQYEEDTEMESLSKCVNSTDNILEEIGNTSAMIKEGLTECYKSVKHKQESGLEKSLLSFILSKYRQMQELRHNTH
jgi:hypothetical protein